MLNNLFGRFGLIAAILLLCWLALKVYPLKGGPDLAGGVDLIYELDLSKYQGHDTTELANRLVETLKRRVDPQGVRNLTWRVISGGQRIEILMPLANEETQAARKKLTAAEEALQATNLKASAIGAALQRTGAERAKALEALAAGSPQRQTLLQELAKAYDARAAAEADADKAPNPAAIPASVWERLNAAKGEYDTTLKKLLDTNIDVNTLTIRLEEAESPKGKDAQDWIDKLKTGNPSQKANIEAVEQAFQAVRERQGGGFDDPADLQRMLRGRGLLDFRIAVTPKNADVGDINRALEQLDLAGPRRTASMPANMGWFEIDMKNGADLVGQDYRRVGNEGVVVGQSKGSYYVLLYTDMARALTHDPSQGDRSRWRLTSASVGSDQNGQIAVNFAFDAVGANAFATMTGNNVGQPMAILLDDKALSAPNIHTAITQGSGQITFGRGRPPEVVRKEADTLVRMLEAGSLPAALQPDPVSVQIISPQFGRDNIEAGLRSGIIAVVAVIVFMSAYYTLSGWFASVAMIVNLIMTLAVMAGLQATWTLPGIAGLVLTLGMAVDANVLINERIREELHHGASLWLAVRQGYDRVFWTIFDSNLTTALTAVVLIFVGSEEVKGFGVTLVIGLAISMFTALFITRTLMIAAVRWGILRQIDSWTLGEYFRDLITAKWLRGRWPFMKVVTVTNFDWISKRHYFWAVSAVITIAGLVAFGVRGRDKYDTEFNGGTQVTFETKADKPMSIADVRERVNVDLAKHFRQLATKDAKFAAVASNLENATNVVEIGSGGHKFQIVTPIADTQDVKVKNDFLDALVAEFRDVLDVKTALEFRNSNVSDNDVGKLIDDGMVKPVTRGSVQALFPGLTSAASAANDVNLNDYRGGVAMLLEFNQPQSVKDLGDRIKAMRLQPDFSALRYHDFAILPVQPVGAGAAAGTAPTTAAGTQTAATSGPATAPANGADVQAQRVLVLASDPLVPYSDDNADTWQKTVAGPEWKLVREALTKASTLQGVTSFDPVVADQAKIQALIAIVISLLLIVIYVWFRFGGIRYGLGAILSLGHDAIVALAATVLSGVLVSVAPSVAGFLHVADFKINLTMIAAYLTIIGYSVNDTIVIFDRIRENRGRSMAPLTAKLVNDSINQCFGRTIWTTFTVFIVVLIMYLFGGEGVRGFSFAMLIGVFTGAYSTLAIASPMLLSVKEMPKKKIARFEHEATPSDGLKPSGLAPQKP